MEKPTFYYTQNYIIINICNFGMLFALYQQIIEKYSITQFNIASGWLCNILYAIGTWNNQYCDRYF